MKREISGPLDTRLLFDHDTKTYSYQIGRYDNCMQWWPILIATTFYSSLAQASIDANRSLAHIRKISTKLTAKHYRHIAQDGAA